MTITAGIDIGGTNLRAAAVLADGTIVAETSLLAPAGWDVAGQRYADLYVRTAARAA